MSQTNQKTAELILIVNRDQDAPPRRIPLFEKNVVIGREISCNVILKSLHISRRHATLKYLNGKWFIRDDSKNGLDIGQERLTKGVLKELQQYDELHLIPTGNLIYRFEYKNEALQSGNVPQPPPPLPPPVATFEDMNDEDEVTFLGFKVSEAGANNGIIPSPVFYTETENQIIMQDEFENELILPNPTPRHCTSCLEVAKEGLGLGLGKRKSLGNIEHETEQGKKYKRQKRQNSFEDFFRQVNPTDEEEKNENNFATLPSCNEKTDQFLKAITSIRTPGAALEHANSNFIEWTPQQIRDCEDVSTLQNLCKILYHRFQFAKAQTQILKIGRQNEREDYLTKLKEAEPGSKEIKRQLHSKIKHALEIEFNCFICFGIFIEPTIADCGHTFCRFCIEGWIRKNPGCRTCRKPIQNLTKHFEVDNFLVKIYSLMPEEMKAVRGNRINERNAEKQRAAIAKINNY